MILTKRQEEGLKIAIERYKHREKYTVISGYAGSGKSTLVKFIIEAIGVNPNKVCYAAFTGKAAEVLRQKGNKNSMTLHKLLYDSVPKADGTFYRRKKPRLDYSLIVADECSMIPKEMVIQLASYPGVHVIYLGDPFQIPPIDPDSDNHLLDNPHCFLDEIMRQAAESEIIRVSMDIRGGKPLELFDGNDVKIINKSDLNTGMMTWADIMLVGTNKTRVTLNNQMRELLGKTGKISEGEKLICRRNYWDIFGSDDNPIVNGSIGYLNNTFESFNRLPYWADPQTISVICGDFTSETNEIYSGLSMDKNLILTGQKTLDKKIEYRLSKNPKTLHLIPMEFEYGYAITCHRAQGSQWDKVLVVEERFPFDQTEHARWLYTAVTRAADKLVLVRK